MGMAGNTLLVRDRGTPVIINIITMNMDTLITIYTITLRPLKDMGIAVVVMAMAMDTIITLAMVVTEMETLTVTVIVQLTICTDMDIMVRDILTRLMDMGMDLDLFHPLLLITIVSIIKGVITLPIAHLTCIQVQDILMVPLRPPLLPLEIIPTVMALLQRMEDIITAILPRTDMDMDSHSRIILIMELLV